MTNGSDRLLSTVILKFRKQMAILTITQRHEIKCIFGPIRLGGSQLVGVVSHVGAAVPACGLPPEEVRGTMSCVHIGLSKACS